MIDSKIYEITIQELKALVEIVEANNKKHTLIYDGLVDRHWLVIKDTYIDSYKKNLKEL